MAKMLLVLTTVAMSLTAGSVWGQTSLIPKSNPRLPPQAGEGLPHADQEFLKKAMSFNALQLEAATIAAEKAQSEQVKQLAATLVNDHRNELKRIRELAESRSVILDNDEADPLQRQSVEDLKGVGGGDFDRDYIAVELDLHRRIVELYQTQASNSTDTGLASFAITSLVPIQRHFDHVQALGAERGLTIDRVKQPPQY